MAISIIPCPAWATSCECSMTARYVARRFNLQALDDTPLDCDAVAVQVGDVFVELVFDASGEVRLRSRDGLLVLRPEDACTVVVNVVPDSSAVK